jgi:hypothetical protein
MTKSIIEVIHDHDFTYEASLDEFVTYIGRGSHYNEEVRVLIDAVRGTIRIECDKRDETPIFSVEFSANHPIIEAVLDRLAAQ